MPFILMIIFILTELPVKNFQMMPVLVNMEMV